MSATAWSTAFNHPLRRQPPSPGMRTLRAATDAYRALDRAEWSDEQVAVELVHPCQSQRGWARLGGGGSPTR